MMLEGIPVVGLSAPAIVSILVLMLFTGKLWTNAAYQQKCKESEDWKAAYEKEREARQLSSAQTVELLELAKTSNSFLGAVFQKSGAVRKAGGVGNATSLDDET